ncbi:putative mitochondrial 3-demethylubiquinone-9 3-methyltransferase [Leptomonas pyrrhocoris]|uniref:Ubiquinone biosynthesis O-methyltransferase, mitochondrial n=1 Tax=Leptomonas pyrrhocoris TaxID=157538 RepID=A0A0M9GAW7_LEPPY|nr:putative mitochondrial 3-demethylubiquinone-9 3-methyltransferase [Leptomonas pyrrhocoris]KPA86517.1 putative mitochondrial 3-demethylubiquinone-9 3-methyltransferase [Leptomonas pyrrhocoris]|eukprot:XP_015664956.1 putative mitochondrial 3-demethylubiquinone-9 3-methyltransferase [Leptomonas pyrrhocoris]
MSAAMKGAAADEVAKFAALQNHWWDPTGPLRSLHLFNPIRVRYVNDIVRSYGKVASSAPAEASVGFLSSPGLTPAHEVLDVGCGGGILSESLARLGATVTGIDACAESIAVAEKRRQQLANYASPTALANWSQRLSYRHASLFDVVEEEKKQFDVVVASEVIEHVSDARAFLQALCEATKPGGLLFLSTMDKSLKTAITHIGFAERLTGIVEPGTHDWRKFVPPSDMTKFAQRFDVRNVSLDYIITYPDLFQSVITRDFQINFCLSKNFNTGHYFWAGLKTPQSTKPAVKAEILK